MKMSKQFSTFIRRHIGMLIVLTFAANMIMFSAIITYAGSIPSEQGTDLFVKQKILHGRDSEKWTEYLNIKQKQSITLLKENLESQSNDKGVMDYKPSQRPKARKRSEYIERGYSKLLNQSVVNPEKKSAKLRKQAAIEKVNALANAKTAKVYHLYEDNSPSVEHISVIKSKDKHKNQKAPNTFNAKYIEYFWSDPEFYNKQDGRKVLRDTTDYEKKMYNGTGKDIPIHRKPTNKVNQRKTVETETKGKRSGSSKHLQSKSNVMKSARVNLEHILPNISYITMYSAKGKLGNQMFQLASLLGIAETGNFTPFLSMSAFDLNKVFRLPQGFSKDADISVFDHFLEENYSQSRRIEESHNLDKHRHWALDGYFQSFKYFSNVPKKVKKYLRFHKYLLVRAVEFLHKTVPNHHTKVAIHIRRGDFISSYQMKLGRVAATSGYVQRAMQYFQSRYKNITFIVVSDDMRWCQENIKGDNVRYSTTPINQKGLDLAIISRCDHVIISVGTFGWWGGWLSGGTVIYYRKFPTPGSELDKTFTPDNFYPSRWIGLD